MNAITEQILRAGLELAEKEVEASGPAVVLEISNLVENWLAGLEAKFPAPAATAAQTLADAPPKTASATDPAPTPAAPAPAPAPAPAVVGTNVKIH
jgi:hypothetical protein